MNGATNAPRRTFVGHLAGITAACVIWRQGTKPAAPEDWNPDAELIRLCDRLTAIGRAEKVLFDTIEDENERDVALAPLNAEWRTIEARIYELDDPVTRAGAASAARAAMANCDRDLEGRLVSHDLSHSLLLSTALWLGGTGA